MGRIDFLVHTWVSLHMMWLQNPFQLTSNGKGQKSTQMVYYD